MWPKKLKERIDKTAGKEIYTSIEDSDKYSNDSKTSLLLSHPINATECRSGWSRRSCNVLLISCFYSALIIILQSIHVYVDEEHKGLYRSFLNVVFSFANKSEFQLRQDFFYGFSNQLNPKTYAAKLLGLNQIILLTSLFATSGFYIISTFGNLPYFCKSSWYILFKINTVFRVIDTVYQTVFILQIRHYKITQNHDSFCSVKNTFLFLYTCNFGIRALSTFFTPVLNQDQRNKGFVFVKFWVPFVIFYHFESFIAFYKFYLKV